jgi:hypothetical protein
MQLSLWPTIFENLRLSPNKKKTALPEKQLVKRSFFYLSKQGEYDLIADHQYSRRPKEKSLFVAIHKLKRSAKAGEKPNKPNPQREKYHPKPGGQQCFFHLLCPFQSKRRDLSAAFLSKIGGTIGFRSPHTKHGVSAHSFFRRAPQEHRYQSK